MMPICPPRTDRTGGFTLMEMLVVLTIMGLVAAIMASAIGRDPTRFQRQRAAQALQSAIVAAEEQARSSGERVSISLESVAPDATLSGATFGAGDAALAFYPDGSSSGGTILLAGKPLLTVDWLTGQVARAE